MQQIVEGQRYDINGAVYVGRNGRLELESSQTPTMQTRPADPRLPYQVERDRNAAAASEYDSRIADARAREAEAQATIRAFEARTREEGGGRLPGTRLSEDQQQQLQSRYDSFGGFNRIVDDLENLYQRNLQGSRGGVLGIGGSRNPRARLPLAPTEYETFDAAGRQLINEIKTVYGLTGGEANSPDEVEMRFGPYIPSATDSDSTIDYKLRTLRSILEEQRESIAGRMRSAGMEVPESPTPSAAAPPGVPQGAAPSAMDRTTQTVTAAGMDRDRQALSGGDVQSDPARQALSNQIRSRLSNMMKQGVPDNEIRSYAIEQGVPRESIDEALQFRGTPQWRQWRRERPNEAYPFRDETLNVPMDPLAGAVAGAASSPVGTGMIHSANSLTAGTMPLWGQALGGDTERIRLGLGATREANPMAAMAGDVAGAIGAYGGAGRLAAGAASRFPALQQFLATPNQYSAMTPRALAGDALYGAAQGMGENDDPLSGIMENVAGGAAGRQAPRMFASAISPTGGSMGAFMREGGRPSLGQRFRGTGFAGDTLNFLEEASQSVPIGGRMVRNMREGARQDWQKQRWNDTLGELEPVRALPGAGNVGTRLPEGVRGGTEAHRYAQQQFNDAYDAVRGRLNFVEDAQWNQDLGQLALSTRNLSSDDLARWNRIFSESVQRRINNGRGNLAGSDFKAATSEIGAAIRQLGKNPANRELIDSLGALDDALHQGARRHSPPEVITALDAVDRGYGKSVTLESAANRRLGGADADPGDFGPSDILQVGRREGVRGRRFLRGETPFYEEARMGRSLEDVLPSSGTSERTASMRLMDMAPYGIAGAGGIGGAAGAVDPVTLGVAGAGAMSIPLALRAGAGAIRPRGAGADTVADFLRGTDVDDTMPLLQRYLRNAPRMGGMFGAPIASYGSERNY